VSVGSGLPPQQQPVMPADFADLKIMSRRSRRLVPRASPNLTLILGVSRAGVCEMKPVDGMGAGRQRLRDRARRVRIR